MRVLDLKGVVCPHTQIKALEAFHKVPSGTLLKIVVDNLASLEGVISTTKNAGHKVVEVTRKASVFTIVVKKK